MVQADPHRGCDLLAVSELHIAGILHGVDYLDGVGAALPVDGQGLGVGFGIPAPGGPALAQGAALFAAGLEGSKITVTQNQVTADYGRSGKAAVYTDR